MIVSNYAIKYRVAVIVLLVLVLIIGSISYVQLPREGPPDITIANVFVTAVYEGRAPEDMETLITRPLEEQLNDLDNIKNIRSSTAQGLCFINIEFTAGQDIDEARRSAKDKIDLARADLPPDLDEPIVTAMNFSTDIPVFIFTLSGNTSLSRLTALAEDMEDEIELLTRVKQVDVAGIREREIRIEVDLGRLAAYSIPIDLLMARISQENATISAGELDVDGDKFQVRVVGEYTSANELGDLPVTYINRKPVFLRDVATVSDTFKDVSSLSRLNGEPCVTLSVKKRSGENTVALIKDVQAEIAGFKLPPGIKHEVVMDQRDYIDMMLQELENNIFSGFALVIIVLCAFMGWRNSLFVAIAIPLSMLLAFILLQSQGETLNFIVLFSLVLAVGMLVDNAIVIVENIYRLKTSGLSTIDAARQGTAEVAWPVITSTITTCAAFSPLLFWPGMMGQFMGYMPRTLIIVLIASLFVALIMNPAICSYLIRGGRNPETDTSKSRKNANRLLDAYEKLLRGALNNRLPVLLLGIMALIATNVIYGAYGNGVEMFPSVPPRNAQITVQFPQGTSIERTDEAIRSIEAKLGGIPDVRFVLATVGSGSGLNPFGGGGGTHLGSLHVEFVKAHEREGNTLEHVDTIRDVVGTVSGAEVTVVKEEEGPPTGAPVSIEVSGADFDQLSAISKSIMQKIVSVPGVVDLQDDFEEALPELRFVPDRDRVRALGLDTRAIGNFLRTTIFGVESSKLRVDEDEYDITIRLPKDARSKVDMLDSVMIPTQTGGNVPLTSLGTYGYQAGLGVISRKDMDRTITISGNVRGRTNTEVLRDVKKQLEGYALPRGYALHYGGEDEEMQKNMEFLSRAFIIALGLIFVVLVIQFNSVTLPFVIVASVILSLMGVMLGLLIGNMRFGVIMTGLGCISLAGIVVNNAIVLVDCIIQRLRTGMDSIEAIVSAGRTRLRPVLLTAATTVLGLIPMAIGYSLDIHTWPPKFVAGAESGAWWAPMAVAVIFGLAVATVLTLVLVPVMYSLAMSLEKSAVRLSRYLFPPSNEEPLD